MDKNTLSLYLEPTEFCDSNHPSVASKAVELTQNAKSSKEKTLNIFHFVRDQIKFMMVYEGGKASDTLRKQYGDCGTKTNLQVALLRAAEIPARFHIAALYKECIKGIVSNLFYKFSPKIILNHPWCECYLNNQWISCDTLLDKQLVEVIYKKSIFTSEQIPTIEWDGKSDLNTMITWMHEDKGIRSSLDEFYLAESSALKVLIKLLVKRSNNFTEKLRNQL